MPHYEGKELDEKIAAVFPNIPIDHRIVEAFKPVDSTVGFRKEMGISKQTYKEVLNGNLDRTL